MLHAFRMKGISLVEVIVAMLVFFIGVIGVVGQFTWSSRLLVSNMWNTEAGVFGERLLENLNSVPYTELAAGYTRTVRESRFIGHVSTYPNAIPNSTIAVCRVKLHDPPSDIQWHLATILSESCMPNGT